MTKCPQKSGQMAMEIRQRCQNEMLIRRSYMLPFKAVFPGIVTSGLILAGCWLSDRSKLTTTSFLIINHTTLDHLSVSLPM